MESLCYIFNDEPRDKDYWSYGKKHILNDKFIKRIREIKWENVLSIQKINKLNNYVQHANFEREKVFTVSKAAGTLSLWVRTIVETHEALMNIEPKRGELKEAEQALHKIEEELQGRRNLLNETLDKLSKLEKEYQKGKKDRENLEHQVERSKH